MATKFVRVKDSGTNHEYTVSEKFAKGNDKLTIIDKDAVDDNGRPLAAKPHIELAKADGTGDSDSTPPAPPTTTTKSGGSAR